MLPGFTILSGHTNGVGVGVFVGVRVIVGGTGVSVIVGVMVGSGVFVGEAVIVGDAVIVGVKVADPVGVGVSVGTNGNGVQAPSRKQFGSGDDARSRSSEPSRAASAMMAGFNPPNTGPSQSQAPYSACRRERASPAAIDEVNIIAS